MSAFLLAAIVLIWGWVLIASYLFLGFAVVIFVFIFVFRGQFCILHSIIERHFLVQVLRCGHEAILTRRYGRDFGSSARTRYFDNSACDRCAAGFACIVSVLVGRSWDGQRKTALSFHALGSFMYFAQMWKSMHTHKDISIFFCSTRVEQMK